MSNIQLHQSAYLAPSAKVSLEENYSKLIEFVLDKVKVATNQPALAKELFNATSLEWKEQLERHGVKAEDMLTLYSDALAFRAKVDRRNAFCVEDMLAAWFRLQEKRSTIIPMVKSAADCSKCDSSGFITFRRNEKTIQLECKHD